MKKWTSYSCAVNMLPISLNIQFLSGVFMIEFLTTSNAFLCYRISNMRRGFSLIKPRKASAAPEVPLVLEEEKNVTLLGHKKKIDGPIHACVSDSRREEYHYQQLRKKRPSILKRMSESLRERSVRRTYDMRKLSVIPGQWVLSRRCFSRTDEDDDELFRTLMMIRMMMRICLTQ